MNRSSVQVTPGTGTTLSGFTITSRTNARTPAPPAFSPLLVHERADAAPLDEGDETIDTVSREDLRLELVHEARLGR